MRHYTIREWERIDYGSGQKKIPRGDADRIAKAARSSSLSGLSGDGVLQHGRSWLKAQGIVGVIATPSCQLEVLPKIEGRMIGGGEMSDSAVRQHLIHLISRVYKLNVDRGSVAKLGLQKDTLLEILIRIFCERVFDAARKGMSRQYLEYSDDLPTFRGSLDIVRQFTIHAASPQKLACHFDLLSSNNIMNQVIRCAIIRLSKYSRSQDNQRKLRQLESIYAAVSDIAPRDIRWELIKFDRSNCHMKDLISFSRVLLSNSYQNTSTGVSDGYALLFDMSSLFEEYVSQLVCSVLGESGLSVVLQGGHRSCLYRGNEESHRTKPDLIIKRNGEVILIVDAKWKKLKARRGKLVHGITHADVYQMMAYREIYACTTVMLLYPHWNDLSLEQAPCTYSIAAQESEEKMIVATFDITQSDDIQKDALRKLFCCEEVMIIS